MSQMLNMTETRGSISETGLKRVLIVDDDKSFSNRVARAMEARGFSPYIAGGVSQALDLVENNAPDFAIVDTRLHDGNGLDIVERLKKRRPEARAIVVTGYGNIASAVTAVKMGAFDYLAKPAEADDIYAALMGLHEYMPSLPEHPMSADRVRWEHIQRVFEACNHNVSETARRLKMHRRTLQRILAKRAPR
jgi:two-component system, response regulator RegA